MGVVKWLEKKVSEVFQHESNEAPATPRQQATYLDRPFSGAQGNVLYKIPKAASHPLDQRMRTVFSSPSPERPAFREFGVALSDINDILSGTGMSEQIVQKTEEDGVRKEVRNFLDGRKITVERAADLDNAGEANLTLRFSTGNGKNGREFSFYGRSYPDAEQGDRFAIDAVSYKGESGDARFIVAQAGTEKNIAEILSIMEDTFAAQPCQTQPFAPPARTL